MFKCKVCGREFKTMQALGGHSTAHKRKQSVEEAQVVSETQTQPEAAPLVETEPQTEAQDSSPIAEQPPGQPVVSDEASQSEQIRHYLKRGYSLPQLRDVFHFKESTIRQEMEKLVPPEGEKIVEETVPSDGIPVTRKAGGGIEVINPEAVLRNYTDGSPEDEIELRGMMKLRAAMLMVMDLVNIQKGAAEADAKRLKPVLDLMKETREEQDAAAARAKASSMDIAQQTAHQTALEMANFIDQKIPKVEPPKDMTQMFTKRIDRIWDMMEYMQTQRMFPGYQEGKVPEGWTRESVSPTLSPSPPSPTQTGKEGQGTPPGFTREREKGGEE